MSRSGQTSLTVLQAPPPVVLGDLGGGELGEGRAPAAGEGGHADQLLPQPPEHQERGQAAREGGQGQAAVRSQYCGPMRSEYCDSLDQSEVSIVTVLTNRS